MITKTVDENSVFVQPEDSDDLLVLRRIIRNGDRITGDTTRVIKRDRDYSRPDRGERVRIRVALVAERISLDGVLDRLRIGGTVSESNNESVPHGSHHSLVLKINDRVTISKKKWQTEEKKLLRSGGARSGFILVAIDTGDCGIARLWGTHLEFMPNMYSGAGGKRYKTSFDIEKFFGQVMQAITSILREGDSMIVFGPGETRRKFANFAQKNPALQKHVIRIAEGIDSGGEDGIYTFTKSQAMREMISESSLAKASGIVDEVVLLASKKSAKFAMGLQEVRRANQAGAVESLVFSDKSIQDDEQAVIDLLNEAESRGAKAYGVDSTTDIGLRVSGLGGVVALLRYSM